MQDWAREDPIDEETIDAALAASARELGIAAAVVREAGGEGGPPRGNRIVVTSSDALCFEVEGPLALRGTVGFDGHGFALDTADARGPGEALYLFLAHVATALGARPEAPQLDDEESPFQHEARSWIDACVDDYLTARGLAPGEIPLSIDARPAPMGPFAVAFRRAAGALVFEVRGAGTDLEVTVGGQVAEIPDAELAPLLADVEDAELAERVQYERAFALGRAAPAPAPAFGGKTVAHVWVDGVCTRSEVLDPSGRLRGALVRAAAGGMLDVVRYFSNGTPLLRTVTAELPEPQTAVADFERFPTWRWCPASVDEVARVFREVTKR